MEALIAFGSSFNVSCCFNPSVLNLRHICDNIWSRIPFGNWFLDANSVAARTESLYKEISVTGHFSFLVSHSSFKQDDTYKILGPTSPMNDEIRHVTDEIRSQAQIEEHVKDIKQHFLRVFSMEIAIASGC